MMSTWMQIVSKRLKAIVAQTSRTIIDPLGGYQHVEINHFAHRRIGIKPPEEMCSAFQQYGCYLDAIENFRYLDSLIDNLLVASTDNPRNSVEVCDRVRW